ncbi:MAG: hypothetical protein EON92_18115 [Burkholderiales bacterium]|nr:MAG: hypothetical protein EON92_18115 [Burkholderiales bacterium]
MRSGDTTVFVGYVDLPEKIRLFAELEGFSDSHRPGCGIEVGLHKIRYTAADSRTPGPVFVFSAGHAAAGATA